MKGTEASSAKSHELPSVASYHNVVPTPMKALSQIFAEMPSPSRPISRHHRAIEIAPSTTETAVWLAAAPQIATAGSIRIAESGGCRM